MTGYDPRVRADRRLVRPRRLAAAVVAVLVTACLAPAPASAHAGLQATSPERGARLPRAPAEVALRFDEPVSARLGGIQVVDARGRERQSGAAFHPGGRAAELAVRLPRGLPDGGYTATFRVISDDSHPIAGGFTFTVGAAGARSRSVAGVLDAQRAGPVTGVAFAMVRAVQYAAIAVAIGLLAFLARCWWPGTAEAPAGDAAAAAFARRVRVLLLAAGASGLLASLAGIGLEAALGAGTSLWGALRADTLTEVLGTRFGVVWALAAGSWALVTAGAAALGRPIGRAEAAVFAVPLMPLVLLPGLAGHASVESPVAVLMPVNALHVVAMAGWLGGLAVLVLAVPAATRRLDGAARSRLLAAVAGRFSELAGIAFAVLLVTGAVQAAVEVATPSALVDTAFGRAVLVKLALVALLVRAGRAHRLRTLPALRAVASAPEKARRLLRRLLRAELALGVAVVGVTGALAGYAPPKARPAAAAPAHAAAAPITSSGSTRRSAD
jgi:copper transport protein